jgi:hypothetical protein
MAEIRSELGYFDRQPVICLAPKVERTSNKGKRFLIGMNQLYEYSEDHNATFEQHMRRISQAIIERFDLGELTIKKMADIAAVIQSRIDDLIKMPPLAPEKKAVASAIVKIDGTPFDHEISEDTNAGYIQYTSG